MLYTVKKYSPVTQYSIEILLRKASKKCYCDKQLDDSGTCFVRIADEGLQLYDSSLQGYYLNLDFESLAVLSKS